MGDAALENCNQSAACCDVGGARRYAEPLNPRLGSGPTFNASSCDTICSGMGIVRVCVFCDWRIVRGVFAIGVACLRLAWRVCDWRGVFAIGVACLRLAWRVCDWRGVFAIGVACFAIGVGGVFFANDDVAWRGRWWRVVMLAWRYRHPQCANNNTVKV